MDDYKPDERAPYGSGGRERVVMVRVSEIEHRALAKLAARMKLSVATYMRVVALMEVP